MLTIALLFQYSALIYLLMYLVANYIRWNKVLVFICIILIVLALFQIDSSVVVLKIISMAGFEMVSAKYYLVL